MIEAVNRQTAAPQRANAAGSQAKGESFRALFSSTAAEAAPAPAAPSPTVARAPAESAAAPAAAALPPEPPGVPQAYGPAAIEDHMNQWLMGVLRKQNQNRMEIYQQAVVNWQNTVTRNRELGLAEPAAPAAPQLDAVEARPPGWWFTITS